jgi:hypothetical protein
MWGKKKTKSKRTGSMAQVIECSLCKHNPKYQKRRRKKSIFWHFYKYRFTSFKIYVVFFPLT